MAPLRQDIVGFTKDIQQFIAKDPSTDRDCQCAQVLSQFLVDGMAAHSAMGALLEHQLPDKLSLLDPVHSAAQQAVLACKHAVQVITDKLNGLKYTAPSTEMGAKLTELIGRSKTLVTEVETAMK